MESQAQARARKGKAQAEPLIQAPLVPHPHYNQQLFSDHFLDVILPGPDHPEWQALTAEAAPVLRDLQTLFAHFTPSGKEAQTEDDFIKPVLRRLGHTFEVQPSLETPGTSKTPDYVFYRDEISLTENKDKKLNETLLANRAIAVGDAKYWDRPLDISLKQTGTGGDPFSNKNPSYQIAFYMQHSGLAWGILTNGRLWRLYHKDSAHKLNRFYEVNLPELLTSGNVTDFLYFYAFFRRQAFEPDGTALSLANLLKESIEHARGIGDSLKEQVYEALRHVAQGFLDYPGNGLQPDPETLRTIYDNSLIVLYRLLFILYAEDRHLLPVQANRGYGESYSLKRLKEDTQRHLVSRRPLLATTATLWVHLKTLFTLIDEGNAQLDVAIFNGGLFDPHRHAFLETYQIGDRHLQQAIDKLARVKGQFVDYRDLAERHLGTIYEGLLEYHLEPLASPVDGWTIELKTAKGERKASGSYYTPDYVVKYIVEETLGPVLQRAIAGATTDQEKIQAVLNVKVLDPAMGSGHFPVEATEYIARFLVEHVQQTETGGESELAYWRRRVAQACIYGIDLNPLAVELAKLSLWLATVARDRPLSFLDHHLRCGNSLLGARVADLKTRPASPKKIRKVATAIPVQAAQPTLFDEESLRQTMTTAVDLMWLIESNPAQTITDVKKQENLYLDVRRQLVNKYQTLADLVCAASFGLDIPANVWSTLSDYALGRDGIFPKQFDDWLTQARVLAATHRFFHWELEFPEVFFDRHGHPKGEAGGFDVVLGNPPYVRQEELSQFKSAFAILFPETHRGVADLYVYFYQQGLRLTRTGGRMSYIVTNKWMRAGYGEPLRAYFAQQRALERIIDFGHAPIFEDADVFPCILVLDKPQSPDEPDQSPERQVQVLNFPRAELSRIVENKEGLASYVRQQSYGLPLSRFGSAAWNLEPPAVDALLTRIRRAGIPLAEFAGVKPYRGVLTGLNEAFLIDTATKERLVRADPRSAAIIKPYLRGQDIKRWSPEWAGLWMIFTRRGINIDAYPAIKNYLLPFRERLEPKPRDWTGGEWPGRKPGSYRWYEIQDAVDYWQLFEQPKIIYQEIQFAPAYSFDDQMLFCNNKVFLIAKPDMYLLGVLNSPLMHWHNWRYLPQMMNDTLSPVGERMEILPIAQPTDEIRVGVEGAVARLIEITRENQEARGDVLAWLRTEFEIEEAGKRLESFDELESQEFLEEVRRRRPIAARRLTPAALKDLRAGYDEQIAPLRQRRAEAALLERRVSDLVNAAYGLTPEEIALLWATAPPRMPLPGV